MTEPGKAQQPPAHPLLPTAEYHCGNCQNTDCDWYPERETLSRINTHGDNHFSMRLATEMSGCRFHTSASQQRIDALERLDIKFTELVGAIEEKQVDGMLSNKDRGDYELVCYCRGIIRSELKKERRSRPSPALIDCAICPNPSLRNEQFRSKLENQRKMYEARITEAARQARSSFATTLHEQLKIKHKKGIVLTYDNVCDMIRESLRQDPTQ